MSTIILIAGGTGSGKTTLSKALAKRLDAVLIDHDRYYKNVLNPQNHNYDEPKALDNRRLQNDLTLLKENKTAHLPIYDFATHTRQPQTEVAHPNRFIIVEGILILAIPEISILGDIKIYVDTPADIRLLRRIRRDTIERGRSIDSVLKQYEKTVRPMHEKYIEPSKSESSFIVNGCGTIKNIVEQVEEHVKTHVQNQN